MRSQRFGIEIEMTGLTRCEAAKVLAGYFRTETTYVGGSYDAYTVRDHEGRQWKIMKDSRSSLEAMIFTIFRSVCGLCREAST